jgi:hypothetical protein
VPLPPLDQQRLDAAQACPLDAVLSLKGAAWYLRTSPERLEQLGVVRHEGARRYVHLRSALEALERDAAAAPASLAAEVQKLRETLERCLRLLDRASLQVIRGRKPRPYRPRGS